MTIFTDVEKRRMLVLINMHCFRKNSVRQDFRRHWDPKVIVSRLTGVRRVIRALIAYDCSEYEPVSISRRCPHNPVRHQ